MFISGQCRLCVSAISETDCYAWRWLASVDCVCGVVCRSQVIVSASNTGPVKFVDSSFWGPADANAKLYGSGVTTFESCEFVQWDLKNKNGAPSIQAYGGGLIVQVTARWTRLCG